MVLDVDPNRRRVSLGIKQCTDNPWNAFGEGHDVGAVIKGEVKNITEFGLFIGLDGGVDGMVHLSDLSWDRPGEQVMAEYKKGDMVEAKVLDVDVDKERISLGIKQLTKDPFSSAAAFKKGATVTCTVARIKSGGIEVTVGDGIPAFIRKADLARDRAEQRPDRFAVGDKVDARVTSVDAAGRRIGLSVKSLEISDEREAMAQYGSSDSGASLGDILGAAIKAKDESGGDEEEPAKKTAAKKTTAKKAAAKDEAKPAKKAAAKEEAKPAKKKAPAKKAAAKKDAAEDTPVAEDAAPADE
jgi:small subunit ribosomal protein S1